MIYLHAKRIIPCASPDMQPGTNVYLVKNIDKIMLRKDAPILIGIVSTERTRIV